MATVTAAENQLQRSDPESQGISSAAILKFVDTAQKDIHELHSLMILRHGSVVAEGWWKPHTPRTPHMLYSLSKSFTSTAIGLAVAEGRLTVNDKVLSFFPDDAPAEISENLATMRVWDLLTMSTGHAEDVAPQARFWSDGRWVKHILETPVPHKPGTFFLYNSPATYLQSAIVQKVTGEKLIDYLQPRLFKPLGIEHSTWETAPEGINLGWAGLSITTEDIARFGQLYLQKGVWNGQQLVPASWIEDASAKQVRNDGRGSPEDWEQGYGYQFWRCRHNIYRADGAFGQFCLIMPDQDAIVAVTSGMRGMQSFLDLVWNQLLPAMTDSSLPADPGTRQELTQRLAGLRFDPPTGASTSSQAAGVSGKTYALESNEANVRSLSFRFSASDWAVTIQERDQMKVIEGGYGAWRDGKPVQMLNMTDSRTVASGVWTADDTFVMTIHFYETPYYWTVTCRFEENQLIADFDFNVAFGPTHVTLRGEAKRSTAEVSAKKA